MAELLGHRTHDQKIAGLIPTQEVRQLFSEGHVGMGDMQVQCLGSCLLTGAAAL